MLPKEIKLDFLAKNGLIDVKILALPQDASSKSYDRVISNNGSCFILLYYPEDIAEFNKFIAITKVLLQHNLIAPEILAADSLNRLILLEDFGDISLRQYLISHHHQDEQIYKNLLDLMLQMQQIKPIALGDIACEYASKNFLKAIDIWSKYYFEYLEIAHFEELRPQYLEIWEGIFADLPNFEKVFVHRDFHVDNLFFLQNSKVGILDYQDCVFSSPIYDLASLLDDARIDVRFELRDKMLDYYCQISSCAKLDVLLAYDILAAQRNTRVLGVFARKALNGNNNYLPMMDRVANYLAQNLAHPRLIQLKTWMQNNKIC